MGLSDESRLSGFFDSMKDWRKAMTAFAFRVNKHTKPIVNSWIKEIDTIVGAQVTYMDADSCFLFSGGKNLYKDIIINPYDLEQSY